VWEPIIVPEPPPAETVPGEVVPSPQLMTAVWVSRTPTSVKEALIPTESLMLTGSRGADIGPRTGATLLTTKAKVVEEEAPSLSVAVTVTVWLSAGPSTAPKLQVHVPLLWVTLPTLAVMTTVSRTPGSENEPLLVAVWRRDVRR
jgi:hypothetical protein